MYVFTRNQITVVFSKCLSHAMYTCARARVCVCERAEVMACGRSDDGIKSRNTFNNESLLF